MLASAAPQGQSNLVACSALRQVYRDRLRAACTDVRFVILDGGREVIAKRLLQVLGVGSADRQILAEFGAQDTVATIRPFNRYSQTD